MPVYAFKCPKCGYKDELSLLVWEPHIAICPRCEAFMKKNYQEMIPAYHDVPVDSVDTMLTGEPIRYHTKGQLKKLAKKHHCEVT